MHDGVRIHIVRGAEVASQTLHKQVLVLRFAHRVGHHVYQPTAALWISHLLRLLRRVVLRVTLPLKATADGGVEGRLVLHRLSLFTCKFWEEGLILLLTHSEVQFLLGR